MRRGPVVPPPAGLTEALDRLVGAILASPHNLMSPSGLEALHDRHLPECLALAERLPVGPGRLVDIGSGAGLPGLVIALRRPDLHVELVESTEKKAAFLERMTLELGRPDVVVHHARAEELGVGPSFDLATARAVAPLVRLIPLVLPLLRPEGLLYAVKGRAWRDELEEAQTAIPAGWDVVRGRSARDGPRVVIITRAP